MTPELTQRERAIFPTAKAQHDRLTARSQRKGGFTGGRSLWLCHGHGPSTRMPSEGEGDGGPTAASPLISPAEVQVA